MSSWLLENFGWLESVLDSLRWLLAVLGSFNKELLIHFTLSQENVLLFTTPWTQDVNLTHIRRSEIVQDVFWTPYVRLIYVAGGGIIIWFI